MITLDSLIANIPEAKDIDALSDWFAEAVLWADENNEFQKNCFINIKSYKEKPGVNYDEKIYIGTAI